VFWILRPILNYFGHLCQQSCVPPALSAGQMEINTSLKAETRHGVYFFGTQNKCGINTEFWRNEKNVHGTEQDTEADFLASGNINACSKRRRLWLAEGSCIRHRPEFENHVWSYDFVEERTHDGRPVKILNIIDEFTRERLVSFVARRIRSQDVIFILADLFLQRGCPKFIRSDNGPEFIAKKLKKWLKDLEVQPLFIEKGSPWENGYCESFNGKMRFELLNGEMFYSLLEAKIIIERWRRHYNTKRPHSALGGRPPAPETFQPNLKMLANDFLTL